MLWKVLRIVFINITLLLLTSTINAKTLKKATLLKWTQVYSIPGYDYSSYNKFIKTEDYTKLKALNLDDLIPQQKGLLKKGVKVEIIEESNDYLHVRYKKDKNSEYTQGWATKSVFKIPKKKLRQRLFL